MDGSTKKYGKVVMCLKLSVVQRRQTKSGAKKMTAPILWDPLCLSEGILHSFNFDAAADRKVR